VRTRAPGRTRRGVAAILAGFTALILTAGDALSRDEIAVAVHHAFGTRRHFTIEGRVLEREDGPEVRPGDSRTTNFLRTVRSLHAEEQKGAALRLRFANHTWELRSDSEGYFALQGETPPQAAPGWHSVHIEVSGDPANTVTKVLIVPDGETIGVISDIDDTVVVSEVGDRTRLLAHTFLENSLQRRAVPGVAALYRGIAARNAHPESAPVIYLTAAPRHLLPAIGEFLAHNNFPVGPIIAKKVTDGGGGDPLLDQERYKLERIEAILSELPDVRFVLSGDDGERDPEVYRKIRERHPTRVEAVYIRRVSGDPSRPTYEDQLTPP